jgi:hypothetical protein
VAAVSRFFDRTADQLHDIDLEHDRLSYPEAAIVAGVPVTTVRQWKSRRTLSPVAMDDRWATPGELAAAINPATVQTPALDLIDAALVEVANTPDGRLIITMPPQEGKSTRVAGTSPPGGSPSTPTRASSSPPTGRPRHPQRPRDPPPHRPRHPAARPDDRPRQRRRPRVDPRRPPGGVLSVGIGGGLTGRPADLLIIDDPIKDRKEADSETYRQRVWDWWTDVASTRLAPGAPSSSSSPAGTRTTSPAGCSAAEDGHLWRVAEHPRPGRPRPEKGETDPLGREPGEFMPPPAAAPTPSGRRSRSAPVPAPGRPLPGPALPRRGHPVQARLVAPTTGRMWIDRPTAPAGRRSPTAPRMIQSWDLAFKATDSSDWVVGGCGCPTACRRGCSTGARPVLLRGDHAAMVRCPRAGRRRC